MYRRIANHIPLLLLMLLALGLRLLVWDWHRLYDLGGDEREYFNQAITLLRDRRYVELNLMRPPLYTGFLAACIYIIGDSVVHQLRLVQAFISALTVLPAYGLAWRLFGSRPIALVAAALFALNYTLASNATELLTETLFVFGLTTVFWLLLEPSNALPRRWALLASVLAGLGVGTLALLRSVALPLLPLGAVWLFLQHSLNGAPSRRRLSMLVPAILFVLSTLIVILPWTARNYLTYGAPILIDTTGPENLWLDNDPAGREAVKQQLYAMGQNMAGRQQLALERGTAVILADPGRFIRKAWGEATKFFALEYFDDMRQRQAIWIPPLEVWLRLLLGDALWLVLLLGGVLGFWFAPLVRTPTATNRWQTFGQRLALTDPRWLMVPWVLYTLLTALIFHVELRYRLPIYPALLGYAAWLLSRLPRIRRSPPQPLRVMRPVLATCTVLFILGLQLLHRPYLLEGWMLANKHLRLSQAERALQRGDGPAAERAARAALSHDPASALAQVALTRAALVQGDLAAARATADAAIAALPAHPQGHLLRGALLRAEGDLQAARSELAYERASREDLQRWAQHSFAPLGPPPSDIAVGAGLDLGFVRDFWLPEPEGFRWSTAESHIALTAPPDAKQLVVRVGSGRPANAPPVELQVLANGALLGTLTLTSAPADYTLPISVAPGPLEITLRSPTFRPRDYDRANPDDRSVGVMVYNVALQP